MRRLLLASSGLVATTMAVLPFKAAPPPFRIEGIFPAMEENAGSFDQFINHKDPDAGAFQQRYWWNTTFWDGPGSPIVVFTPGEVGAENYNGYMTDRALPGAIAREVGGAVLLVEHRYWGSSMPADDLTTSGLQQHTLDNTVADFVNFAKNAQLPFDETNKSNAEDAPWIWTGGSYSGNLAAWIEKLSPGTFWAYHASSSPVEAVYDYWSYFHPIQQGMPRNCSRDLERIIDHVDNVLMHGSRLENQALKKKFLMQDVEHDDDMAGALSMPLGAWQGIQLYSGYSRFFNMCDAIEGVKLGDETVPGEDGIGMPDALDNFANWWADYFPGNCETEGVPEWDDPLSVGCLDSYNKTSPVFTDVSLDTPFNRQWFWMLCNEPFSYWQVGAPEDRPSIISRLVTPEYYQRQCPLFFPTQGNDTYGSARGETAEQLNRRTDGWFLTNTTRLIWTNGEFDPWRTASVSSEFRPGGPLDSRPGAPVHLLRGAHHCNDLLIRNSEVNKDMGDAVSQVLGQLKTWTAEFYEAPEQLKKRGLSKRRRLIDLEDGPKRRRRPFTGL